ncbi:MAG: hypothetical protein AAGF91_17160, partial [Actinomycetota bacterium]
AGDLDEAHHRLDSAVATDARGGGDVWACHARALLADVHDLQGRCDVATRHRREVREVAQQRGFVAVAARAGSDQASAGTPSK